MRQQSTTPDHTPGDFARLSPCTYTFTTERGMYRIGVTSHSGLSATEKKAVVITHEGGSMSFEFIRKYLKRGLRCNVTGFGGWDTEPSCIEAMTRHLVARHEQRQAVAA